jgi:DNA-binding IclR family transcriptional regulator
VFGLLSDDPGMTLAEVAARTGPSLAGVRKIVRRLQDCALLARIGSARNGRCKTLLGLSPRMRRELKHSV